MSPALLHLYNLDDAVVVIIDIFRATSTIVSAIYNGAKEVIPVDSVERSLQLGSQIPNSVTAGERDGFVAQGLQYGNSPTLYTPDFIQGKTLVLTTTNGTRLLFQALSADDIIIGAFTNLQSVVQYLRSRQQHVILACASWKDRVNMEDPLFAGAVASALQNDFSLECDSTQIAKGMYESAQNNLLDYLKVSNHYKRLSSRGLEDDLIHCTQTNICPCLPIYKDGAIVSL